MTTTQDSTNGTYLALVNDNTSSVFLNRSSVKSGELTLKAFAFDKSISLRLVLVAIGADLVHRWD